jgi:hypothetical protein
MRQITSRILKNVLFAAVTVTCFAGNLLAQDCSTGDCGHDHSYQTFYPGHHHVLGGHAMALHGYAAGMAHGMLHGQGATSSLNATSGAGDLFHNYYTQGYSNQATAEMYVAPRPVPAWVGHTYYTYQPLYPHHYMYWHKDRYHAYYDNGRGLNRTSASYYSPPVRTATHSIYKHFRIAR